MTSGLKNAVRPISVNEIETGLRVTKVAEISKATGLSELQVRRLSRISASSFARRQKTGKLTAEESDRLARLSRITTAAVDFFQGERDDAHRWLHTPAAALDEQKPIDVMINDAGVKAVEDLLIRLEHGVFT